MLVWGLAVRGAAEREETTLGRLSSNILKAGAVAALTGPCGAAVWAVWERDEMVFGGEGKEKAL